jgi:hypothetical protein
MKRGTVIWVGILLAVLAFMIIPTTHKLFLAATTNHPYIAGFIKFAVLATMGDFLALRIVSGKWQRISGMGYKALIWGAIGLFSVMTFPLYSQGVHIIAEMGLIPVGSGTVSFVLTALWTAVIMDYTGGLLVMGGHRVADAYVEARISGNKKKLGEVVKSIDWSGFINFVVAKTLICFWVPAHTITFMLPSEYRILFAALLGIALGAILSYAKRRKPPAKAAEAN